MEERARWGKEDIIKMTVTDSEEVSYNTVTREASGVKFEGGGGERKVKRRRGWRRTESRDRSISVKDRREGRGIRNDLNKAVRRGSRDNREESKSRVEAFNSKEGTDNT